MSNKKILTKAIKKAIDNGWLSERGYAPFNYVEFPKDVAILLFFGNDSEDDHFSGFDSSEQLIFDHDFARALWTGQIADAIDKSGTYIVEQAWQYHLQQMVLADNPIKYLGENI